MTPGKADNDNYRRPTIREEAVRLAVILGLLWMIAKTTGFI